jgi:hypothetical protein
MPAFGLKLVTGEVLQPHQHHPGEGHLLGSKVSHQKQMEALNLRLPGLQLQEAHPGKRSKLALDFDFTAIPWMHSYSKASDDVRKKAVLLRKDPSHLYSDLQLWRD